MKRRKQLNIVRLWFVLATCSMLLACKPPEGLSSDQEWNGAQSSPVVVVFVHGVLGHPIKTFAASASASWPEMMADESRSAGVPLHVMSVGYMSNPMGRGSNITEIANRLKVKLQDKGILQSPERRVVFMTHSMGGLIVKRMLVQLAAESVQAFQTVAGVFFLATPSGGSDLASVAQWVSANPQFADMQPQEFNNYLQTLEDDWQGILRRRPADRPYPLVFCAYEKIGVGPGKVVVPRGSAQASCDETPIAFDRDHISIAKPASPKDEVYTWAAHRIESIKKHTAVRMTVSVEVVNANGAALAEPLVLHSGDGYALKIRLSKPGWVYVFGQDSSSKIERYFPSDKSGAQISAQTEFRVPGNKDEVLVLDRQTGVDRLFIVASAQPDDRLSELYKEIDGSDPGKDAANLRDELLKRGATVAHASAGKLPSLGNLRPGALGGDSVATVVIEHR